MTLGFTGPSCSASSSEVRTRSAVAARARAEAHVRRTLGRAGQHVRLDWDIDRSTVALRVRTRNPVFVLPALGGTFGFDRIDRTVRVRLERMR